MPGQETLLGDARDRLSRIGGLFLSEDGDGRDRLALHTHPEDAHALPAIDLARAIAGLGRPVTVIEASRDTLLQLKLLSDADSYRLIGGDGEPQGRFRRRMNDASNRDGDEIFIIESTTAMPADTMASRLLAVPADGHGMRRAWMMLKTLAGGNPPLATIPAIGVTITGAVDLGDAEDCHARFAAAAGHFLGIEVISYACLLRDGRNREQELRNIAALLIADFGNGAGAAAPTI